ncbi:MAG: LolA family protein [bacterium]
MSNLVVDIERTMRSEHKTESAKGTIFYQPPDDILIHITEPVNQWLNSKSKTLLIYYPDDKKAFRIQAQFPFTLTFFQAFIGAMKGSLGLTETGFTLHKNERRGDTLVTYWSPPAKAKRALGPVIIGLVDDRMGFMEMRNNRGKTLVRVSYSQYHKIDGLNLPLEVSAVRYMGKDTTYETVHYRNPRLNIKLPDEVVNFKIPDGTDVKEVRW